MTRARKYHPAVADDLKKATQYDDALSPDLGNRFRSAIRSRLQDIANRPESFGRVHDELRAAGARKFPYVILFKANEDRGLIIGIFHAHSNQRGWFARR
jgi:plasmid stabilization system protein ParE